MYSNVTIGVPLIYNQSVKIYIFIPIPVLNVVSTFIIALVNPVIALFGLTGTLLSIVVLAKSGLRKPSNILLAALCVTDVLVLVSMLNIPRLISYIPNKRQAYTSLCEYSETECRVLFVITIIFQFFYFLGSYVNTALVPLIIAERILAVFYPLHFKTIVTRQRIWLCVIVSYILWLPWSIYITTFYRFTYQYYFFWDLYAGTISITYDAITVFLNLNVILPLGVYASFTVVTFGSFLIVARVRMKMQKRQKMTSTTTKSTRTQSRTTKMLLIVCVMYSLTKFASIFGYVVDLSKISNDMQAAYGLFILVLINLNRATNFVIYVAANSKFRKIFMEMVIFKKIK
ncbi:G-protein coupled receptor [Biomphalaria glabrata]|nr:G-protein coupled receptor [Biomphalaria glabrata]